MKQRDLIKKLEKAGFRFVRHGSRHDAYVRGLMRNRFHAIENSTIDWRKP